MRAGAVIRSNTVNDFFVLSHPTFAGCIGQSSTVRLVQSNVGL